MALAGAGMSWYVPPMFQSHAFSALFVPVRRGRLALPIFTARIAAGFPSPADDFSDGTLDLNDLIEHPSATFILRVAGDSMVGAGVFDGDLLVVDRSIKPRPGQIVVASLDGEMLVKRLEQRQGRWWLVPANKAYRAQPMPEGAEVWGVVKNVVRSLP
ncbi:hypothetical protein JCM17960_27680 [Magnetospira thiophila]